VNGGHLGAVSPEDLIAYLDGEASPDVAAHVRDCPECSAAAAEYARELRRLQGRLFRFECPPSHHLGEYELGVVSPEQRTAIAAHVVECPLCTAELRTLRDFLAGDLVAGLADPAPGPVERLRRVVATVLAPRPAGAYAGLRGAAADTGTRTYQAGDISISLSTAPVGRRGWLSLSGLIWRENVDGEVAGSAVALIGVEDDVRTAQPGQTTEMDELGNFTFDEVDPGAYRLEVTLGDQIVVIDDLQLGR
jgi:anti-sigma factor RsiW